MVQKPASSEHQMRLCIDIQSVKELTSAANIIVWYSLELTDLHVFETSKATSASKGTGDGKLSHS